MTKAAKKRPHLGKRIKDIRNSESEIYSLLRRLDSPSSIQSGGSDLGGGGVGAPPSGGPWLPIAGGQMIGPIAFFPKLLTIGDGEIDASAATGSGYSSRIIVSPESGSTDTLLTITGAAWSGQLLFLQGVETDTITIKDSTSSGTAWVISTGYVLGDIVANGGNLYSCKQAHTSAASDEPGVGASWESFWFKANIETVDGNDFNLVNDDIIILMFDATDNKWQQVTTGQQGVFKLNEIDLGTISGSHNIDWSLAEKFRCVIDGNVTFSMINTPSTEGDYQQIILEVRQDATGGHTVTFADTFENDHVPLVGKEPDEYNVWAFYGSGRAGGPIFSFNTFQSASLITAMSDENTPLTPASSTIPFTTFRMPYAMIVTEVKASLTTAGTTTDIIVDIWESGTTILSTKLHIDPNDTTSKASVTTPVISDNELANDAEIQLFLTQRDGGNTATGLKLTITGYIS